MPGRSSSGPSGRGFRQVLWECCDRIALKWEDGRRGPIRSAALRAHVFGGFNEGENGHGW